MQPELIAPRQVSIVAPELKVGLATSPSEREALFRLRHEVFSSLGAHVGAAGTRLDQDEFDDVCEQIGVWDGTRVIAASRVLLPEGAGQVGRYFSSTEFDISALLASHKNILEIGRVCVHPDYRRSPAVAMMFRFVTWLATRAGVDFLMGCGTLFEKEPARIHAIAELLRSRGVVEDRGVAPVHAVPPPPPGQLRAEVGWGDVAPLIRTYLLLGARILGTPCMDPIFDSAEVLILMAVSRLARHFGRTAARFDVQAGAAAEASDAC